MIRYAKGSRVYVIGFYPCPETVSANKPLTRWHFEALHYTYGVTVQLLDDPGQILPFNKTPIVAVEQKNSSTIPIESFAHPEQAVYVVGNNSYSHPSFWFDAEYRVHIDVPAMDHPLYGDQAASIILHDRYMKNGKSI